jgi:hypothetical protein
MRLFSDHGKDEHSSHVAPNNQRDATWNLVQEMVGNPDYAVQFAVWPWPDGGWMAGIALVDSTWALRQKLTAIVLEESYDPAFDMHSGFSPGMNVLAPTPEEAVRRLYRDLNAAYDKHYRKGNTH